MAEIAEYQVPTLANEDEKVKVAPSSPAQSELSEKEAYIAEKPSHSSPVNADDDDEDNIVYVKGEPVITTGRDVSRFVVDIRDDGDPALTFRSFVLGTLCSGLGATLIQIYQFKPVQVSVSTVFLLLLNYTLGLAWAAFLPKKSWAEKRNLPRLARFFGFINPGKFQIKEHVVSSLIASTASGQSTAVLNFAVQRLYYNTHVHALTAVLATFSTAMFGYGIVGILRPLTVYPSEMVYWANLPTVTVFQSLHYDVGGNTKRLKIFWVSFTTMFCWEVIPSYIFPLLNGFNIFCLASQKASANTINVFTNFFGGTDGNEGLGFGSISFDWQYITSAYMAFPFIQQANSWVGIGLCYVIIMVIYYTNAWESLSFPMLSTSVFNSNGSIYQQSAVFGTTFKLNQTALDEVGLPYLTGSNVWANFTANLAIGGLVAHCLLFWTPYVYKSFKHSREKSQPDPHWQAMQKYKEADWWWYLILIVLAFLAGLIVVLKGETTLPVGSYIVALLLGTFIAPFSNLLFARMGNGIATNQLMKMVAGAISPGRPVANLYFSMWSHDVVGTSIGLAGDLKIGQYLKIPPRVMFLTQVYGSLLGCVINYVVMISVVDAQREILLDPVGTNVWSGQVTQSLNSAAITWSLAKQLYGPHSRYFIVPLGLVIGLVPTTLQWLITRRWTHIGRLPINNIMLPIIYMFSSWMSAGVNSVMFSTIITGIVSQFWLRKYHPGWFKKYNYIMGGALDGGAQVMIFILSFAVFGASGSPKPFPTWAGNPAQGNVDYCNGNGALD